MYSFSYFLLSYVVTLILGGFWILMAYMVSPSVATLALTAILAYSGCVWLQS